MQDSYHQLIKKHWSIVIIFVLVDTLFILASIDNTNKKKKKKEPDTKEEWISYYYSNVKSHNEIDELGHLLYQHICIDLPDEE